MEYDVTEIIVPNYNSLIEYITKNKDCWKNIKKLKNDKFKIKLKQKSEMENFILYKDIKDVFNDYYFGSRVKHGLNPDNYFTQGDVVTTNCGWDLGIVSESCNNLHPRVYAQYNKYDNNIPKSIGGNILWYKTGVNIELKQWKEICKLYW